MVSTGDSRGTVTAVSLLVTHIRAPKRVEITIPNSMILGTHVTNFSNAAREDGIILPSGPGHSADQALPVGFRHVQHGLLAGFAYKNVDFTTYVFDPEASQPTVVLAVGVRF